MGCPSSCNGGGRDFVKKELMTEIHSIDPRLKKIRDILKQKFFKPQRIRTGVFQKMNMKCQKTETQFRIPFFKSNNN